MIYDILRQNAKPILSIWKPVPEESPQLCSESKERTLHMLCNRLCPGERKPTSQGSCKK